MLAEQPILPAMLAAKNAGNGLAALIPPNMRAMAVRVDDVVGVAGFIHPDDRVDVLVTLRPNRPGAETTTKVFMQNVKVLAVGQEVESNDKARLHASPATVATLLVSPSDSERLALAAAEGRLIADAAELDRFAPGGDRRARSRPGWSASRWRRTSRPPPAPRRAARRLAGRHGKARQADGGRPPPPHRRTRRRRTSWRSCAATGSSSGTSSEGDGR